MFDAEFILSPEMNKESISPIIATLNDSYGGEKIKIAIPHNVGGNVNATIELILALKETKANLVVIEVDRYVMSSASFLWLWFFIRPEHHVKVTKTDAPALMIYHRPRITIGNYVLFSDDIEADDPLKNEIEIGTHSFDILFNELIETLFSLDENMNVNVPSNAKHQFDHMMYSYYANNDCVIAI